MNNQKKNMGFIILVDTECAEITNDEKKNINLNDCARFRRSRKSFVRARERNTAKEKEKDNFFVATQLLILRFKRCFSFELLLVFFNDAVCHTSGKDTQ